MEEGIYIVSSGATRISEITQEGIYILNNADFIFCLDNVGELHDDIKKNGSIFISLSEDYERLQNENDRYKIIAEIIASKYDENRVVFLTDGHPRFYNDISLSLEKLCVIENIPLYVTTGISTLDKVFADVIADPSRVTIACIPADRIKSDNLFPCDVNIILQPASVFSEGSAFYDSNINERDSLKFLSHLYEASIKEDFILILYQFALVPERPSHIMMINNDNIEDANRSLNKSTLIALKEWSFLEYE